MISKDKLLQRFKDIKKARPDLKVISYDAVIEIIKDEARKQDPIADLAEFFICGSCGERDVCKQSDVDLLCDLYIDGILDAREVIEK